MSKFVDNVRDFHRVMDVPVYDKPGFPSKERIDLRLDLHAEEYNELCDAIDNRDMVEAADAIADLIYVLVGTAHEFGIPLDKVWDEVQRSNMSKVDPVSGKVLRRKDGKVLKGPHFSPPRIDDILDAA